MEDWMTYNGDVRVYALLYYPRDARGSTPRAAPYIINEGILPSPPHFIILNSLRNAVLLHHIFLDLYQPFRCALD